MAAVINTNYLSLVAQNNLNKSQSALGTAIERLSSGMRINSAKDDAAGMAIANRFTANVKGLTQAARNANDGISLAQTTEGAASEVNTHLQRVRELSVQAANGSYSQEQLDSMQDEINQRLSDINRISEQTDFNGVKVLSNNAKPLTLQVGANDGETITINLSEISVKTLGLDGFNVNGSGVTQNRSANVNDMTGPNVTAGAAGSNEYTVKTTNVAATASDVLGKFKNGDSIAVTGGATYTYNATAGNFDYTAVTTKAKSTDIDTAITSKVGTTPISGSYSFSGQSVNIKIDGSGAITDTSGNALYYDGKGNLSATDNNAGWAQAKVSDLTGFMADKTAGTGSGATAGVAKLTVGTTTYQNGGNDTITSNATASKDVVLSALAGKIGSVTMGSGLLAATMSVSAAGVVSVGAAPGTQTVQLDSKGELTDVQSYTSKYKFDQVSGKISAIAGGDTMVNGTATGVDQNAKKLGQELFISSNGTMTFDTTSAGTKTANPLKQLDVAFKALDKLTGELGAVQNRLESTISNLNNVVNNLSAARSRIQDADYATEVSNMGKAQILQQAGTSVLAQANQVPQTVLSLLR